MVRTKINDFHDRVHGWKWNANVLEVAWSLKSRIRYVVHCGTRRIHLTALLFGYGWYATVSRIFSSTTAVMDILVRHTSDRKARSDPVPHNCRCKSINVLELRNYLLGILEQSCCVSAIFVCSSRYEKNIGIFRIRKLFHSLFLRLTFEHWNSLKVDFYSSWHTFA